MKPIQMSVLGGEPTDTVYFLMDDGTVWRGWQVKKSEGWGWKWEQIPLPGKEAN